MDTIGKIIMPVWVILMILGVYSTILGYTMRTILYEHKIKTNCFSFYWSYKLFKDFIEENEFKDSVRMEYIRLYKNAIWTKRILLLGILCVMLFVFIYYWLL